MVQDHFNIFLQTPFPSLVVSVDEFKILNVNEACKDLFTDDIELTNSSYFNINDAFKIPLDTTAWKMIEDSFSKVKSSKEINKIFISESRKGGNENASSPLLFVHSPILDESQELTYILQTILFPKQWMTKSETTETSIQHSKQAMKDENLALEDTVRKKTHQLESTAKELDDFVYSVSHDLRAPLRRIDGFSQELAESYMDELDEMGQHYLKRIRQGAQDMGNLIDDLLKLSRISRRKVEPQTFNLTDMGKQVFDELMDITDGRSVTLNVDEQIECYADPGLIKIVLYNLFSNAIKFTAENENAKIELGSRTENGQNVYYIKDNGVGFDPEYSSKLFKAFQRLHSNHEFEGTGIGLVTVKRIISSHGGQIWAEGTPGEGATFYFTLK